MEDTKDPMELQRLKDMQRSHIVFIKRERSAYAANKIKAEAEPLKYLSIIIDGADQSDHDIPHWAAKSHISDAAWKIKLHLLGVLIHGVGSFAYTCPSHVKQGNNVTIQALWDSIVHVKNTTGRLAPTLLLQLDNTTKQNKGNGLFGFLAWLESAGIFRDIEVAFLPVGHTHSDIDQFFSRIAVYLRTHDCLCREEFAECIRRSFNLFKGHGARPIVRHWESVANISQWLQGKHTKFVNITEFYHFRFTVAEVNEGSHKSVRCQARRYPGDSAQIAWQGLNANEFFLDVFPVHMPPPNMAAEWDSIPAAQCTTVNEGKDKGDKLFDDARVAKMRKDLHGLAAWSKKFATTTNAFIDCMKILDLLALPMHKSLPFHWKKEDLALLMNSVADPVNAALLAAGANAVHSESRRIALTLTLPIAGFYNIIRPQENYAYPDIVELFWIAMITQYPKTRGGDGADKDDVGYLWKKLEPHPSKTKDWPQTDPYKLRYCIKTDSTAEFAKYPCQSLQDLIIIDHKQREQFYYISRKKGSMALTRKLKSYVDQWAEPVV